MNVGVDTTGALLLRNLPGTCGHALMTIYSTRTAFLLLSQP